MEGQLTEYSKRYAEGAEKDQQHCPATGRFGQDAHGERSDCREEVADTLTVAGVDVDRRQPAEESVGLALRGKECGPFELT